MTSICLNLNRLAEECLSSSSTPPLPPVSQSPMSARLAPITEERSGNNDSLLEKAGSGEDDVKEEKEEKKPLFNPQGSAAMAKIALVNISDFPFTVWR